MEKTSKPIVTGILNIIVGAIGILVIIGSFICFSVVGEAWNIPGMVAIPGFVLGIGFGAFFVTLVIAILVLVGGIFAVQRKLWGWALTGSIAAIYVFFPVGIATTILVAISKNEFE